MYFIGFYKKVFIAKVLSGHKRRSREENSRKIQQLLILTCCKQNAAAADDSGNFPESKYFVRTIFSNKVNSKFSPTKLIHQRPTEMFSFTQQYFLSSPHNSQNASETFSTQLKVSQRKHNVQKEQKSALIFFSVAKFGSKSEKPTEQIITRAPCKPPLQHALLIYYVFPSEWK